METLSWGEIDEEHLAALTELAEACLEVDGGLPLFKRPPLLRARLLQSYTLGAWHHGQLVAAVGVGVGNIAPSAAVAQGPATATGLVHPRWRGRGLGTRLISWADQRAGDADLLLTTETWSATGERLFTAHGLHLTFSESVLRHHLDVVPAVPRPETVVTEPVTAETGADLFATYCAAFADRPGFVVPEADEWLGELHEDDEYRPDLSLLARGPDGQAVGFVNIVGTWIDQVGVVPAWRKRRVGAYLVASVLRSLAAENAREAWLCVNDDNPAGGLYRRLGFADAGRRARYLLRRA
ncbi:GNAT family N-acetyltransferase [Micromonospora avicenniae]|nr:GNAT family N-acetyltransferase [Micromonospora avicenniae]